MQAMVIRELKDHRRNLLIWIGAMLGMVVIGAAEYSIVVMDAAEEIMKLFESLPRVFWNRFWS
jgi:ABC-2 type transport system permease protein